LHGTRVQSPNSFVLAASLSVDGSQAGDRMETRRSRLGGRGIDFLVWDETEISTLLKDQAPLVDDFFGRDAVRVYLGHEVATALGDRLDASEMLEYRAKLGDLYGQVFHRLELGIRGDDRDAPLDSRFVLPYVLISEGTSTGAP